MTVGRLTTENPANDQDFIAYLQGKGLAKTSVTHYLRHLRLFLSRIDKEVTAISAADIIAYLACLKQEHHQQNGTRNGALIALNHYYTHLYKSQLIGVNPCLLLKIRGAKKRSLYKIYNTEALEQLYDNFHFTYIEAYDDSPIKKHIKKQAGLSRQRNVVMLSLLLFQGVTTKELELISIADIDLNKATIRIPGGLKSNERKLPILASQIGVFINYLQNVRPHFCEFYKGESDKLFLAVPECGKQSTTSETLRGTLKSLTAQVSSIDPLFLNFLQIRTSVITHWLKTVGLRKTQYMAGHRYISSTERYLANDLEGLTSDIARLHPF